MAGTASPAIVHVDVPLTKETVEDVPWSTEVVDAKSEVDKAGVYGVGLQVGLSPPYAFVVRRVTGLQNPSGEDISNKVNIGDVLCFCNDRSVVKEGENIIESTILGELNSLLKVSLKNSSTGQMYDLMVRRHVTIRQWDITRKWYEVKPEFMGKDLAADSRIVSKLDNLRRCAVDKDGTELDFLAGIKKRGSDCGVSLEHQEQDLKQQNSKTSTTDGRVKKIAPGSPASFVDIQVGDLIIDVDDNTDRDTFAMALKGDQRIGTTATATVERNGRRHKVEMARTQVSAMGRVAEMLSVVDEMDIRPDQKEVLRKEVLGLEKERLYEERVMAGRLNTAFTNLLNNVTAAADCLCTPPEKVDNLSALLNTQQANEKLSKDLNQANATIANLQAELDRLKKQMSSMVPESELTAAKGESKLLSDELEALKKELATLKNQVGDMVPKAQYEKMEATMHDLLEKLRKESKEAQDSLKASELKNIELQTENDELKRKLKNALDEAKDLSADLAALRKQLKEAQDARDSNSSELDALKRKLKATTDELEALRPKLKEVQDAKTKFEAETDTLKRQLKTAQDENAELKPQIDDLKKKLKALQQEGDKLTSEKASLERKVKVLETDAADLRSQADDLKKKLKAAVDESANLKTQLEAAKRSAQSLQADLDEANTKLKVAKDVNSKLILEIEELKKQLKKSTTDVTHLTADKDGLQKDLQKSKAENADLLAQLEALKRKAKEAADQVARLEQEKTTLGLQLKAANDEATRLKGELDAVTKKLRGAEDQLISSKSEVDSLKAQLQEAKDQNASLAKELKTAKEQIAKANETLKKAQADLVNAKAETAEVKNQLVKANKIIEELQGEIAQLQQKLKESESTVRKVTSDYNATNEKLTVANDRCSLLSAELEELKKELEAMKQKFTPVINENTKLKSEVEKLKRQLVDSQASIKQEEKDHAETRASLEALMKDLAAAGLGDAKLRKEFLAGLTVPPVLLPTGVLRMMKAAKQFPSCNLDKLCDLLDTMAVDACVSPQDVTELLKQLLDSKPRRSAQDCVLAVKALNRDKLWTSETLMKERELLKSEGVETAEELNNRYKAEIAELKKQIRILLAPEFDTEACTFEGKLPLTIRAREGATVYANIHDGSGGVPTITEFDKSSPTPLMLLLEESSVVTVMSSLDGKELSEVREKEYKKKKEIEPVVAPEIVGVGMLLSRQTDVPHSDIFVKTIYDGGAVHNDGTIKKGDVLVEVNGQAVQLLPMEAIFDHIRGPIGSEVTLLMEKSEFAGKREELCADGLYTVKLIRQKPVQYVGVGMNIARPVGKGVDHDIVVKEIFHGGAVHSNGEIAVGDVLVKINGQSVENMSMDTVTNLIKGSTGTEVVLLMEKAALKGARESENPITDGLFTVTLIRSNRETNFLQSFVDSSADLMTGGWNSMTSLVSPSSKPRPASLTSPGTSNDK